MDLADKYPPAEHFDRDTLPPSDWDEDTVPSFRNPMLERMQHQGEKRYPGIGLLIVFGTGFLFWGVVLYFVFR
jgi:hypothetical protein